MDIQKHIKELMDERGWTNYRLGKEAGLSHSTITNPCGKLECPSLQPMVPPKQPRKFFLHMADGKERT